MPKKMGLTCVWGLHGSYLGEEISLFPIGSSRKRVDTPQTTPYAMFIATTSISTTVFAINIMSNIHIIFLSTTVIIATFFHYY